MTAIVEVPPPSPMPAAPPTLGRDGPARTDAVSRQRARGKLLASERLELLLDPGSFQEIGALAAAAPSPTGRDRGRPPGDGVVTGWGRIGGRSVVAFAQDFTVLGGSLGEMHAAKVRRIIALAQTVRVPVIGLLDGGGARIDEGVAALDGFGRIFVENARASGVVPQISVILGPCAGGAVYSPAMTEFTIMTETTAQMFITGPDVVRAVTGEEVTPTDLGGADVHARCSGAASFVAADDAAALALTRELVALLPPSNAELPPRVRSGDPADRACAGVERILPANSAHPYDMRAVLSSVVDDGSFLETHERWAPNLICALARIDGNTVGIVANQPSCRAGVIDCDAAQKGARFVRTCDAFNVPLITFVDVPGFQPGASEERRGIIRYGAALVYAFCEASVPRIQVIVRKAYGGAYIVMNSRATGADLAFAWPTAEVAVMGPDGAVEIAFRRELAAAVDREELRRALAASYEEQFANPYHAAERGYVDAVIEPAATRRELASALDLLATKQDVVLPRKHGNVPI